MNKKTIIKIIICILIVIAFTLFFMGWGMRAISDDTCRELCKDKNALSHQTLYSGNWAMDDVCCCIFSDRIKAWRMG